MPLKCSKCNTLFEVRINSEYEANRLQEKLWEHTQIFHPGAPADYQLVDEEGVSVLESTSTKVREEQKQLDSRARWIN